LVNKKIVTHKTGHQPVDKSGKINYLGKGFKRHDERFWQDFFSSKRLKTFFA
jgi:hypothetical protein